MGRARVDRFRIVRFRCRLLGCFFIREYLKKSAFLRGLFKGAISRGLFEGYFGVESFKGAFTREFF